MQLARRISGKQHGQPVGIMVRQRPQQNGIHDAENCGIRANAQGQREYHNGAETRPVPHLSHSLPQIARQTV